jgi:hypothetical protein
MIAAPAFAEPLYCSTSFQGYRVCSSPSGYVSHETQWQGFTIGDDNRGNRWTKSRWQGFEITTRLRASSRRSVERASFFSSVRPEEKLGPDEARRRLPGLQTITPCGRSRRGRFLAKRGPKRRGSQPTEAAVAGTTVERPVR